jgi:L-lactate permease
VWALFSKVTGMMNYGYGTVLLSGMMLVNPYMAFMMFVSVSLSSLIGKLVTLWLFTLYSDFEMEKTESSTKSEIGAHKLLVKKPGENMGSLNNVSSTCATEVEV